MSALPKFELLPFRFQIPALLGWSMIPLHARTAPERWKLPAVSAWKRYQTELAPSAAIQSWARQGYGAAIVTGAISGIVVLDLDDDEAIAEAESRGLPVTVTVATGRGRHVYFQHPARAVANRAGVFPGADVRGDGGYVVAPGTPHPSGKLYEWIVPPGDAPLAEMPRWLAELLGPVTGGNLTGLPQPANDTRPPYIQAAIDGEIAKLRSAREGQRNAALNTAAFALGQLADHLDVTNVQRQLVEVSQSIGLGAGEISATLKSGWAAGERSPRCLTVSGDIQEAEAPLAWPEPLASSEAYADLCSPPGLVGALVRWMEATSDRPNPILYLGAALALVAALAGRKFSTATNLRTNLYLVTLAPSGHGKNHALECVKALAAAASLDRFVGPARIMSASALRKLLGREPTVACYIDEVAAFMQQIHDKRAGLHNAMIRYDLLELFSAAGSFFAGAEYAGEAAAKIYAPNLTINGTATPDGFWNSLSSMSSSDGLLARLILIDANGPKTTRRARLQPVSQVPMELVEGCRRIAEGGGNLTGLSSERAPQPKVVPLDDHAEAIDAEYANRLDLAEVQTDADSMPVLNRLREHAHKLALVVSVGCDCSAPVVSGEILSWAYRLASLSATRLAQGGHDRIADNERGAAYGRLLRFIQSAGCEGVRPGRIADKNRGIDTRLREQLLSDLVMAGRVRFERLEGTGGRPRERYVAI